MEKGVDQALTGGIVGVTLMTLLMIFTSVFGLPKIHLPQLLADALGLEIVLGWIAFFIIGIVFSFLYSYFFLSWFTKIKNTLLRGLLFGVIVFALAKMGMQILGISMTDISLPSGDMVVTLANFSGYIVFGIVVSYFVKTAPAKI